MLAVLLDLACGEPPDRWHPVAWLGAAIARLERSAPRSGRLARFGYGAALSGLLIGGSGLCGWGLERVLRAGPFGLRLGLAAVVLKLSLSLRALGCAVRRVGLQLETGRLLEARSSLRALVSRPNAALDPGQVTSAAIESAAENLSDSVVAPLFYYAVGGLGGALAYRAANTLDAMIGYHGQYEALGKAAARTDDLLNLLPARLSAVLLVVAAGLGCGDWATAWAVLRRDHARTASPNAGWPMSAAAGALQVRLEKVGHYTLGAENRQPAPPDLRRANRLCFVAAALGIATLVAASGACSRQVSLPGPERPA